MKIFEAPPLEASEGKEDLHPDKESIFKVLIMNEIISAFSNDLLDADFNGDEVKEFEKEISELDEASINGVLATPKELRLKNFRKYFELVESGKKTIHEIVADMARIARTYHYVLGYHASNNDISEDETGWTIQGKELDDRDNMTMAYYSLDYKNIFRAHRFKWLYVVRAQVGEDTTHKRDTSNNWGRAPRLDVVHRLNLAQIDEDVEKIYENKVEVAKEKGAE